MPRSSITSAPATLRVLGTSVTLLEILRQRAEQDLGLRIEYQIHDVQDAQRIAVMHPERYDLYDQWFHNVDFVWPARAVQPLDINRLRYWDEINDLPKRGTLFPGGRLGDGSVPVKRLYVQHDHSLGSTPTERISMLPLTHNADSFAYHQDRLPRILHDEEESWGWLLHPAFSGQVALQNDAAMSGLDAAYDYLNWWQSGWPGAVMAKQGYYISNPQRSRLYLSRAEWDYWYAGKPASEDLPDAYGNGLIPQGEQRDGGSYEQRMSHIAVWNSVMDEHNYLVRRWHDFLRA